VSITSAILLQVNKRYNYCYDHSGGSYYAIIQLDHLGVGQVVVYLNLDYTVLSDCFRAMPPVSQKPVTKIYSMKYIKLLINATNEVLTQKQQRCHSGRNSVYVSCLTDADNTIENYWFVEVYMCDHKTSSQGTLQMSNSVIL